MLVDGMRVVVRLISGADPVPNMPKRLRELRLEMGWTLDDVATVVGVTQRGVVSNWEATNHRRRIPELGTLLILQRWYGVSMDYLIGHPDAERESPSVKHGRRLLRERLRTVEGLGVASPSDRAQIAVRAAQVVAPEAFFLERMAAVMTTSVEDLEALLDGGTWPDQSLQVLGKLFGFAADWFYVPEPVQVLNSAG